MHVLRRLQFHRGTLVALGLATLAAVIGGGAIASTSSSGGASGRTLRFYLRERKGRSDHDADHLRHGAAAADRGYYRRDWSLP
jgi:hypothetical protein